MLKHSLDQYGITSYNKLFYNISYDELYEHETAKNLIGYEKGIVSSLGAVAVDTGIFTGRSPKDKYIVENDISANNVWWSKDGSDNKAISQSTWQELKNISISQLNGKDLYVIDGFCGANKETRLAVRLVTEIAWMAHFFKNMFIRPEAEELENFKPDWVILNACKAACKNYQQLGLRTENFVAFNLEEKMTLIGNTWYGGEIKKGIFSIMNYFLPLKNIGSFHCSANASDKGDSALFFGLSGTGKTTLSTDPKRKLIGDDEHGWDNEGVFNLEGGCYAKVINLSADHEPEIYAAIKKDALLENVVMDSNGKINFTDNSKTDNTRVSYPIYHIENIVKPISKAKHPNKIVFLTCDAYGVLPPVSKLTPMQAMYQFLSGYTAKIAGTELGIKEPVAVFSSCFGQPFLLLHPTKYAEILYNKMLEHNVSAYLVNTGWHGGGYGFGTRISIKNTRNIVDAILDSSIENSDFYTDKYFGFQIPKQLNDVDNNILTPSNTWKDKQEYDNAYRKLVELFINNFKKFTNNDLGKIYEKYGPKL
ncbi:phosphoenolpyruvate carboxykinase (ATP) [Rickettsiales bacterium LUAb2]